MAKHLLFEEQQCILQLRGIHRIASLTSQVIMPYDSIRSVTIGRFKPSPWMLRLPGTSIPGFNICEGRFYFNKTWYFLSYESDGEHLIIELDERSSYRYVIIDIDHATTICTKIREQITRSLPSLSNVTDQLL